MKLEIPVKVYFDDVQGMIDEIQKLQTYKLFEGDDMVLVNLDAVATIMANHIRATDKCSETPNGWIPCSEYPEYDFEDVLIRWHDKRKGCEDDYILCEGYVVRKHWCCIFEDADMSDYEPVEWVPISQRRNNVSEFNQQRCHSQKRASV